jgi:hypothetical protein
MTSRTFIGQNYALRQSPSTPGVLRWDAGEACCQARDPDRDEGGEREDRIEHLVGVGPLLGMQIGLHGVVERKQNEHESGAAEPGKPGAEEFQRGFRLLRTEPVLFVGEMDHLERAASKNAGQAKHEQRGNQYGADEKSEKNRFGLPAIREAAAVEVRSELIGQPRIVVRKTAHRKDGDHDEQHFGQA